MLAARGLAIGYRGATIGRGLTLDVKRGEVVCLLGPNGCGKTTLFKTLLGLIPGHGGQVELDGRPIADFTRAEFARSIGYVPQASAAYFPFGVLDVVLMGRASHIPTFSSPSEQDRAAARRALDTLGVSRLADKLYTEISGGERQMVLIARALAQEPELIVMDEPTASLDFGNQTRVLAHIRGLSAAGIAVVLSTHDPGHAFACADRVAMMKDGGIVALGSPESVVTPSNLRDLYGVEVTVAWIAAAGRHVCAPYLEDARRTT